MNATGSKNRRDRLDEPLAELKQKKNEEETPHNLNLSWKRGDNGSFWNQTIKNYAIVLLILP